MLNASITFVFDLVNSVITLFALEVVFSLLFPEKNIGGENLNSGY